MVSARAGAKCAQGNGKGLHSHKPCHVLLYQGQGHSMSGTLTGKGERERRGGSKRECEMNLFQPMGISLAVVTLLLRLCMRMHARTCVCTLVCVCVCTDLCEVTRVKCVNCGFSTRAGQA